MTLNNKQILGCIPYFFIGVGISTFIVLGFTFIENSYESHHLLIYIAGKYSGTPEQIQYNVQEAINAGTLVLETCNYPIVPHFGYYFQKATTYNFTYNEWMQLDSIALKKSDAVLKISNSHGADIEEKMAKSLGIPIYYDIRQVPNTCDVK